MNLADRGGAVRPQDLHDAELQPAQRRASRHISTTIVADLTTYVARMQEEKIAGTRRANPWDSCASGSNRSRSASQTRARQGGAIFAIAITYPVKFREG